MARITLVKHARQRYEMVPVLDSEGRPVKIPLTNKDGSPKKTKRGREVFITKTVQDRSKPLPMPRCDAGSACVHDDPEIKVGTSYKHKTVKSTYGGRLYTRHADCPNWQPWETSDSTSASVARIQHEAGDLIAGLSSVEDFEDVRNQIAEMAGELRDEKSDNLSNLPESFQRSGDLYEQVEALESWVSEIESVEPDELNLNCDDCSGSGKTECAKCGGSGEEDDAGRPCSDCDGDGQDDCENCEGSGEISEADADVESWLEGAREALQEALDGCEV